MWWLIASVGIAAVSAVAVPLDLGRRNGRRWGIRRRARVVDPNPYRGALVHEETERGAPSIVRVAAGANVAWGVLTLLVFAPAGCLLFLLAGEAPLFVVLLAPIVLSGFLLAFRLMGASSALLQNETDRLDTVVTWSIVHHLAVSVFFGLSGLVALRGEGWLGLLPSIPAGIGVALACLLDRARQRANGIPRGAEASPEVLGG